MLKLAAIVLALALAQEEAERGRKLFDNHCARCHGIGGTGGEGPSLARRTLRHAADDAALASVIENGIEGTEMPGTWLLSPKEIGEVVAYVRSLGKVTGETVPGDAERGRTIFEGKGSCSLCHVVAGEGGILGPELTDVGAVRGAAHLRESLLSPPASLPPGYLPVRAVTASGEEITGVRVNEDSFTIQVRDETGRIHSLQKVELRELQKRIGESLMPSTVGQLSDEEVEDVVAYLASLRGAP